MSEYLSPDELIRELLNVLSSAEADLIEIVEYNNQFSKAKNIDLFNDRL